MENQAIEFYQTKILQGLADLTEEHKARFKAIFSPRERSLALDQVVAQIPPDNLDSALRLVQRIIENLKTKESDDET